MVIIYLKHYNTTTTILYINLITDNTHHQIGVGSSLESQWRLNCEPKTGLFIPLD